MVDANQFQSVTRQSWFGRLGDALKGVLVGLVLLVVSFPLLFWNEGRAVRRYKTLVEGAAAVVSVSSDAVDPANEGRLVHVSATTATTDIVSDPELGVSAPAIRLGRRVEMFQWRETSDSREEKKVGGGTETVTTYEYSRVWSDRAIDSSRFEHPVGHENPGSMPFGSTSYAARQVALGAYALNSSQIGRVGQSRGLALSADTPVPASLGERAAVVDGGFHVGDPANPEIGDLRVRYSVVEPGPASVVARQVGNSFEPYPTDVGGSIDLLESSTASAAAMFESAQSANTVLTWIVRAVGFFVMFLGISMMLRPLSVTADVIPMLGNLVGVGVGLVAFLLSAALASVTIGVAWLFYRPLLGGSLLAVALVLLVVVVRRLRAPDTSAQPAAG